MVYDSTMGQYLLTIPAIYVPGSGIFDVVVRGDDISDVLIRLQVNVADDRLQTIITAIAALNNISVDDILDEIVSASSHTTAGSFARLLYILYCGSIGGVVNTQSARTIKDSTGTTLVTNSITSDTSSVTRTGGHE